MSEENINEEHSFDIDSIIETLLTSRKKPVGEKTNFTES